MTSNRVSWIEYKGEKILYADYSNATPDEIISTAKESVSISCAQEKKSILQLVDVSNANYDLKSWQTVRQGAKETVPYSKASAVLGVEGAKKYLLTVTKMVSKRNIKAFDNINDAKEWLVSQK
ncbi:MAG: hypothetical protein JRI53_05855 [Deltaproteobacteria bacterium]|nr:hypothetical protein [Deltaproteobacteria bacterium]MBW1984225.1 hypothetical protein [Deltaproteobacteria bacterium]MBW2180668.1 hypothetical protein [Deltaproteobacteria bacterium]